MNLDVFRSLCRNANVSDQELLAYIMELKREYGEFSPQTKDEVRAILEASRRDALVEKINRNINRRTLR